MHSPVPSSMLTAQLAYPGEYLEGAAGSEDAYTDKVGGSAVWPAAADLYRPAAPPVPVLCGVCGGPTMLMTQLYLPATKRVRTPSIVWVHACNKAACGLDPNNQRWVRATRLRIGPEEEQSDAANAAAALSTAAAKPASATSGCAPSAAAAPTAAAAPPAASSAAPAAKVPSSPTDEWGVKKGGLAWSSSDDDDEAAPATAASATKSKPKPKATKSKPTTSAAGLDFTLGASDDAESDDDAALNALLAQQSLADTAAKTRKLEASAKASAKAEKQERKMEERRQAAEALREAALAARAAAEEHDAAAASSDAAADASSVAPVSSSSLAAATSRVIAAATTVFAPFYLAWTAEPPASALELSREMRLLREYERRMEEEGAEEELAAIGSASAAAGSGVTASGKGPSSESEGEEDEADNEITREKREDESQTFFDLIARNAEQCVRYYEPTATAAAAAAASASSSSSAASSSSSCVLASTKLQSSLLSTPRRCSCCGSPLVVELQLLPRLLYELHVERVSSRDPGMDWTCIDVFSCVGQCTKNRYVEEEINVQPPL